MQIEVSPIDMLPRDVFTDSRTEWEVTGEPFATGAGRIVHARVRKVDEPALARLSANFRSGLIESLQGHGPLRDGPESSLWSGSIRPLRPATGYPR